MSHQDQEKIVVNHETIKQVLNLLLPVALFAGMKTRRGATWKPRMLAAVALLWAVGDLTNLTDRFNQARKIIGKIFRWQEEPGTSYQGFIKMLQKWHVRLREAIVPHLRTRMQELLPEQWKIAGYVVFACDGSRVELPRTEALEDAYSAKSKKKNQKSGKGRRGAKNAAQRKQDKKQKKQQRKQKKQSAASVAKKKSSPQVWLTSLWHVGTGMLWGWRSGPSDSSEREHVQEMLSELPKNSLITADAGFVGYLFWKSILDANHHFVIRVGSNVKLIRQLGYARQYEHTVYLWPDEAMKKRQPPLALRLIVICGGKHPVYLVTNLSKSQLSDEQAATIYAARWGIELFYRSFKQTFGRCKLRSRVPQNVPLELDWSLVALWCVCLLGQRELAAAGKDPTSLSLAAAIKAFQSTIREYRVAPESAEEQLWSQLRNAMTDDYVRTGSKASRHYPSKKTKHKIGKPEINPATQQQINAAKELKQLPA